MSFLLWSHTFPPAPTPPPTPDLLFYYIWVGKHLLWLSECCFHLQFYFVLQNHSGILLDPKAIVWKHFSKASRKKDIYSSLSRFLYHFFLFSPCLRRWPLICPFRIQGKARFYIFIKSQCYLLSFARCRMCNLVPASRAEITTTMPPAIKVSEAPPQQNTWSNT